MTSKNSTSKIYSINAIIDIIGPDAAYRVLIRYFNRKLRESSKSSRVGADSTKNVSKTKANERLKSPDFDLELLRKKLLR